MFHLFQTYVAFKCFMLHVFPVVQRVRGRRGMGRDEQVADRHGVRRAGGQRSGARQGGGVPAGAGEKMGMGAGCADGGSSGIGAGLSGVGASVRWNSSPSDVCALAFPFC